MNYCNSSPLHTMMSQGINVVLAKALMNIECKLNHTIVAMDCAWEEKFQKMKIDYDEKLKVQGSEIKLMSEEIRHLKECTGVTEGTGRQLDLEGLRSDVSIIRHTMEQTFDIVSYNVDALTDKVKDTYERVSEQEDVTSAIQDFMEDFIKVYECRNGVVDFVITKHENDLKTSRDTLRGVSEAVSIVSKNMLEMRGNFIRNVDVLQTKLDEYIVAAKWNETHVSVDEHNQLRLDLEDQIIECDMKYDHVLLTVQQQWDQCNHRSEELDVVKGVITRAKKQREVALSNVQAKYRILTESIDNETKTSDIFDDLLVDTPITKQHPPFNDKRKVHFFEDRTNVYPCVSNQPCVGVCNVRFEIEDNESEFGNSVNLVLLDEYSVH